MTIKNIMKVSKEFVEASIPLLGSKEAFWDSANIYSGSIYPQLRNEMSQWKTATGGAIPSDIKLTQIFDVATVADLTGSSSIRALNPASEVTFKKINNKSKDDITEEISLNRVNDYEASIFSLACSSAIVQDTFKGISKINSSWIETAVTTLQWIKEAIIKSVARVYSVIGKLIDNVTPAIDNVIKTLSEWTKSAKDKLISHLRALSQALIELINDVISSFFGWLAQLRDIAMKKHFSMKKVTITLDPLSINTVSVLGCSIPYPEVKLPRIEMEFEYDDERTVGNG